MPDPFFIVIESLGRSYQVIAPAYPPVRSMAELVAGVTAILDAEGIRPRTSSGRRSVGISLNAWYVPIPSG